MNNRPKKNYSALTPEQTAFLFRALLGCAMRRLGITTLEVDSAEFECADAKTTYTEVRVRPGGGFIVELTDNAVAGHS